MTVFILRLKSENAALASLLNNEGRKTGPFATRINAGDNARKPLLSQLTIHVVPVVQRLPLPCPFIHYLNPLISYFETKSQINSAVFWP